MNLDQIKSAWALRRAARHDRDPQRYRNAAILIGSLTAVAVLALLTWGTIAKIIRLFAV